jgi:hypothetical protein
MSTQAPSQAIGEDTATAMASYVTIIDKVATIVDKYITNTLRFLHRPFFISG